MSVTTQAPPKSSFDRWFELSARGSTYGREVRGGLVTFFTMAYIVVLNPLIIGTAKDINGHYVVGTTDVLKSMAMVAAATALISMHSGARAQASAKTDSLTSFILP